MVASLRNINARGVRIGPAPVPPTPPLFEVDFTQLSNGTLGGKLAQDYNPTYANAQFGTWPAGAPLYSGNPWPVDWNGYTLAQMTDQFYVSSGRLYSDGTGNGVGLPIPLYIPLSILNTGVRITAKYIPVGTEPGSPFYRLVPNLKLSCIRTIGGNYSNGEIFYDDQPAQEWFTDYSDLNFVGSNSYNIGQPLWDNTEHTIVWEISSAGRLALTLDGNPLGNQTLEPWFNGYEPQYESYAFIGNQFFSDGDTINSFGYTYLLIEEL